jgi:hypothetical protein
MERKKTDLVSQLENSRQDIIKKIKELRSVKDSLSRLPVLEETLKRYKEVGLEDKLK